MKRGEHTTVLMTVSMPWSDDATQSWGLAGHRRWVHCTPQIWTTGGHWHMVCVCSLRIWIKWLQNRGSGIQGELYIENKCISKEKDSNKPAPVFNTVHTHIIGNITYSRLYQLCYLPKNSNNSPQHNRLHGNINPIKDFPGGKIWKAHLGGSDRIPINLANWEVVAVLFCPALWGKISWRNKASIQMNDWIRTNYILYWQSTYLQTSPSW